MASNLAQLTVNTVWPVSLAEAKNFLKVSSIVTTDDNLIQYIVVPAATMYVEKSTGLMLASRDFVQSLDAFPYYPYSREPYGTLYGVGALALYFGYGPIVPTPFPPYGLNNQDRMPFQIDLLANPVSIVTKIVYVDATGNPQTLLPGKDFTVDLLSVPARVLPLTGSVWPQCTIGANNVQIFLTAGLQNIDLSASPPNDPRVDYTATNLPTPPATIAEQVRDNALPADLKIAIMMAMTHFYFNREAVVAGNAVKVPHGLDDIIGLNKVHDFSVGLR